MPSQGRSPFLPGQPVPPELFVGRQAQIQRIVERGAGQVAAGKPVAMFVEGEYGIGKSSLANYTRLLAEKQHGLHGVYVTLGGAQSLDDLTVPLMDGALSSKALEPSRSDKVRAWLAKYVGQQSLFGVTLNLEALQKDAPALTSPLGLLRFLRALFAQLEDTGVRGLFLVLDEINGISREPEFAHLIKGIVDGNAVDTQPLPLLLMLCGVEERRRDMLQAHPPIDRIFDVVEIPAMDRDESEAFFAKAFASVDLAIETEAVEQLAYFAQGMPKVMHALGDEAFWVDQDGIIDAADASNAVLLAAKEIGKKFVDQQVVQALRSQDYHAILTKLVCGEPMAMHFDRQTLLSYTNTRLLMRWTPMSGSRWLRGVFDEPCPWHRGHDRPLIAAPMCRGVLVESGCFAISRRGCALRCWWCEGSALPRLTRPRQSPGKG
ncbi:MAG: AAA family ATPase [Polyangiales bacterium]